MINKIKLRNLWHFLFCLKNWELECMRKMSFWIVIFTHTNEELDNETTSYLWGEIRNLFKFLSKWGNLVNLNKDLNCNMKRVLCKHNFYGKQVNRVEFIIGHFLFWVWTLKRRFVDFLKFEIRFLCWTEVQPKINSPKNFNKVSIILSNIPSKYSLNISTSNGNHQSNFHSPPPHSLKGPSFNHSVAQINGKSKFPN